MRAAANRECDCGQGDLPLVPRMDIHRRAERARREEVRLVGVRSLHFTAGDGSRTLALTRALRRERGSKWVGRGGGRRRAGW